MTFWRKNKHAPQAELNTDNKTLDLNRLPRHVAFIMDGNGRWARQRGLARAQGHRAGVEAMREVLRMSQRLGIEVVSLYAFSTENWARDNEEVEALMDLVVEYFKREFEQMKRDNARIVYMGDLDRFPERSRRAILNAVETTRDKEGMVVNFALNYGGRAEIVNAAQKLSQRVIQGEITPGQIDEHMLSSMMYTAGLPDPDLLIRTSGEMRISNFMLYQLAYAELCFCPLYWPDFNQDAYMDALLDYQKRQRRFGKSDISRGNND